MPEASQALVLDGSMRAEDQDKDKLATDPGKKTLLKHVVLDGDAKMLVADIEKLCYGVLHKIDYGKNYRDGSKAFQLMLNNLDTIRKQ